MPLTGRFSKLHACRYWKAGVEEYPLTTVAAVAALIAPVDFNIQVVVVVGRVLEIRVIGRQVGVWVLSPLAMVLTPWKMYTIWALVAAVLLMPVVVVRLHRRCC